MDDTTKSAWIKLRSIVGDYKRTRVSLEWALDILYDDLDPKYRQHISKTEAQAFIRAYYANKWKRAYAERFGEKVRKTKSAAAADGLDAPLTQAEIRAALKGETKSRQIDILVGLKLASHDRHKFHAISEESHLIEDGRIDDVADKLGLHDKVETAYYDSFKP